MENNMKTINMFEFMPKSVIDFAVKNHISIARYPNKHYYIANANDKEIYLNISLYPTAKSAINLMKKYLNRNKKR